MSKKIIACATVRAPNKKFADQVKLGKVYRPGDEVPADMTDEERMVQLFEAGVLTYEGEEPKSSKFPKKESVKLGTSKEDGPSLSMKAGDDRPPCSCPQQEVC